MYTVKYTLLGIKHVDLINTEAEAKAEIRKMHVNNAYDDISVSPPIDWDKHKLKRDAKFSAQVKQAVYEMEKEYIRNW